MARCVYCGETGQRWTIETVGFYAPVVLCASHETPLKSLAESLEAAARDDAGSDRPQAPETTLGLDVVEDPDAMIRRLEGRD